MTDLLYYWSLEMGTGLAADIFGHANLVVQISVQLFLNIESQTRVIVHGKL